MSFAEDMGHDIPPMWGEEGCGETYGYLGRDWAGESWVTTENVTIIHQTEKAYLIEDNETKAKVWLPKSQVKYDEETKQFDIPKWLSNKLKPIKS